ncbi:MAG TPA: hypothetical protein PKD74_03040 [Candidatus Dependentiae bacterium]|nr:hypothetical protein [Candidatus Dependentiae bacterium]
MKIASIGILILSCIPLSCLATTYINNQLDYPIKIDLIVELLKNEIGTVVAPGQTLTTQIKGFYNIVHIREIKVYVDEGSGFPEKPTVSKKRDLYGSVKNIIVTSGPADETGEREYIVRANSDLNPHLI